MHPVFIKFGEFEIAWYGVMWGLGLVAGYLSCARVASRIRMSLDDLRELITWTAVAAMVGARLAYIAVEPAYYAENPLRILNVREGGLVFLGGVVGSVTTVALWCRKRGFAFWPTSDVVIVGLPLAHAFGRFGCFMNGCCYGLPSRFGVVQPEVDALARFPVQLVEAGAELGILALLFWTWKRRRFDGQIFLTYLGAYCVLRFVLEFVRDDERGRRWLGLSLGQVMSLGWAAFAVAMYFRLRNRPLAPPHEPPAKKETARTTR